MGDPDVQRRGSIPSRSRPPSKPTTIFELPVIRRPISFAPCGDSRQHDLNYTQKEQALVP